ncbi:Nin one binding Zn-ribbon like-domain-containing protein [Phyllosticta citribraziliensis]|uniref:20S-pre-rRNA D-site endonuclease NOB1 n=1 Tax=Phyllosticta citribraziliensis TaxID=989973 RepID=A0ABR1MCT1_9PEZI
MAPKKPVNSLVIDAGPIIKNSPPVSTLIAQAEALYTIPAVVSEIRDEITRARVETTLLPFLTQRNPRPETVKIVQDFARRTGDLQVLSATDIQLIALAREIECERNGGDWRLRNAPGQKGTNGKPPGKAGEKKSSASGEEQTQNEEKPEQPAETQESTEPAAAEAPAPAKPDATDAVTSALENTHISDAPQDADKHEIQEPVIMPEAAQPEQPSQETAQPVDLDQTAQQTTQTEEDAEAPAEGQEANDSDSDGWITPGNIKRKQQEDDSAGAGSGAEPRHMQAAIMTTDFAMQNVILQMGLNLLSPALQRIKHVKSYVLRCYACFLTTKQMDKQFCPRCGKPSLTRVSCSTSANGEFKLHLKRNFQVNNRGERYSIPKPASKSASGRITAGGGAQGWGADLILTEDQREYERAMTEIKRQKQRDLMDEDYLPGILTGERSKAGGRPKVGAGRNVNSRKRK